MKNSAHTLQSEGIFATMAQLPLLKGATQARLSEIVGRLKFHFFKALADEVVMEAGAPCKSLLFVLSGSVRLRMERGGVTVEQTLAAPQVIAPDNLFGLSTKYPCTVTALDHVGLMEISKEDFRRMLALDPVFLFNYLNTICAGAQRAQSGLLAIAGGSAPERLAYWVTTLTQPEATDIVIASAGREIHQMLGVTAVSLRSAVEKLAPEVALEDSHTLRVSARGTLRDLLL